ncbi:MAG: putative sigma factor [Thermoanaerobacter sp.]|nr:putative sigma factor [Thermoanaerobacter sp.]
MNDIKIKDKYYRETEYFLYNYKMFEISIENLKREIEYLENEDGVTGIDYSSEKISPTYKFSSITEDTVLAVSEKIHYLQRCIERIQSKIDSINRALEGLTEIEREIIEKRYFEGKPWYVIAYEVSYNERWCKELRRRAISKIAIGIHGDTALLEHDNDENI